MSFLDLRDRFFSFVRERPIFIVGVVVILASIGGYFFKDRAIQYFKVKITAYNPPDVSKPTIIGGDLVLPKVMLEKFDANSKTKQAQLFVLSANLFGVFDSPTAPASQNPFAPPPPPPKLIGIRIVGETLNVGKNVVDQISPVIRFFDAGDNELARKVGHLSPGFNFFGVQPNGKMLYDIIVDDPPIADKMEVVLNTASATTSATFDVLKVMKKAIDVKIAYNQQQNQKPLGPSLSSPSAGVASSSANSTSSAQATPSASEGGDQTPVDQTPSEIEYYTISGTILNSLTDPVSDLTVYVWVKDSDGHVFSLGRQDFKGDLISPKKTVDFSINLFPFKGGEKYVSYEVAAWGKRYTL